MQHIQPRYLGKGDLTIEQMKKDFGAGIYSPQYIFLDVKNIPQLLDTKKTKHLQSFFLFIISSDPSTHFISKQLVRLPNNDQKSWSYPDHVDHVKLILLSVAHLILDCCYNDVTTPAAFIFAIWLGYLVRPLREQGVFFLYFQNWCCQFVKSIPQTGHYDMNFTKCFIFCSFHWDWQPGAQNNSHIWRSHWGAGRTVMK